MSLWKRMFGKSDANDPKPGSDGAAAGTPFPPAQPAAGANTAPPPAGATTPKPPKAANPVASAMTAGPWKARPVFISSTFKDMHAERGYLRTHVFPRLEEELRKRRHQIEPIDLRFGVESGDAGTEEERELLVLKVCLGEIRKSRPFLLVLLGDRYGWIPPADRMAAAAREAGFQGDLRGRSVTALEIEYGILKESPDQVRRCFFYLREPLPYDRMTPEVAAVYDDTHSPDPAARAGHDQLVALKQRLQADPELEPRVHRYAATWDAAAQQVTGLEAFGERVFQDIWNELEAETRAFASQPPPTWEAQEHAALIAFVENRVRNFTGRVDLLGQLAGLALSGATKSSRLIAPAVHGRKAEWEAN